MTKHPALIILSALLEGCEVKIDGERFRLSANNDLIVPRTRTSTDPNVEPEEVWLGTYATLSTFISMSKDATGAELIEASANTALNQIRRNGRDERKRSGS